MKQNYNRFDAKGLKFENLVLTLEVRVEYTTNSFKNETKGGERMSLKILFDYSKLRGRIIEKFHSQSAFAAKNNMSNRSMSLKLNNGIRLSQEEIIKWSELLDINREEIPQYFFKQKVSNMKQCKGGLA